MIIVAPIIALSDVVAFTGVTNVAQNSVITPSDTVDSNGINEASVQYAINAAVGRIYSTLGQRACSSGTFFATPFTVGGVPLASATSSLSYAILQPIACQFAAWALCQRRRVQGQSNADDAPEAAFYQTAKAWWKDGDEQLQRILKWTYGYSENVLAVDLDLNAGAVVGQIYRTVNAPRTVCPHPGFDYGGYGDFGQFGYGGLYGWTLIGIG